MVCIAICNRSTRQARVLIQTCLSTDDASHLHRRHNLREIRRPLRQRRVRPTLCQRLPICCRFRQHLVRVFLSSSHPRLMHCVCRIALYGLLVFFGLTKEELVGRRPLAKFLCIKLIVMFTFYQSFVVRIYLSTHLANYILPSSSHCWKGTSLKVL